MRINFPEQEESEVSWDARLTKGLDKTSALLKPKTSKSACGYHLGSILICQNMRSQR